MLKLILFPGGASYPWAAPIYHLILGGFLYSLVAAVFGFRGDWEGPFHLWQLLTVQVAVLLLGWLNRPRA